jgi:DNA-binding NarL/FixJ family response regulator
MSGTASLRVLLIEDSSLLAARLGELIGHLPDVELIDTVASESDALSCIASAQPDVLILDLQLHSGSGFGVMRALAGGDADHRPRVIVFTNFGLPEYQREAETLGAEAFLDKSRDYYRLPAMLTAFARERTLAGL